MRYRTMVPLALLLLAGCGGPIATAPSWAGGGMDETGPIGVPDFEAQTVAAAGQAAGEESERIGARHILVMHIDSQARPEHVVRTRAEALTRAKEVLEKLRGGADFTDMVDEYSDEPGASERGGDLGMFARNSMVKPFSDAAFALEVGELSDIVETKYGFHIIKRTK